MRADRPRRSSVLLVFVLVLTLAAIVALSPYPGNRLALLSFVIANGLMLVLAVPRPRLYGYTFLALFLFLGFVAKLLALWIFGIPLVEPTGAFDGSAGEWDAALLPSIAAAVALAAVRLLHLRFASPRNDWPQAIVAPPNWYPRVRVWVLSATALLAVSLNVANLFAGFYQVGLQPRLVLPAHLNAVISWLLTYGVAMWIAMLVGWELALRVSRPISTFLLPFFEALCSVSLLSRAAFLFRALTYVFAAASHADTLRRLSAGRRTVVAFVVLIPTGFVLSLAVVSALRIVAYPPRVLPLEPIPIAEGTTDLRTVSPRTTDLRTVAPVVREISGMFVGRWIGIEGTMTVASYPRRDVALFAAAVIENPGAGEDALFQHMAGSPYRTDDDYTFLTTPGVVAILYYTGSLISVFAGMLLIGGFLIVVEVASSKLVRNAFVVSLAMLALANGIAQMNFPYLFIVLCAQVCVTLGALALVAAPWHLAPIQPLRRAAEG